MHHDDPSDTNLTRRDALKTLVAGIGAATVIPLVPADVAEAAQKAVAKRKAAAAAPKFFTPAQHRTVDVLSELIIPADDRSPGAKAAQVADYIDFVLSESPADARTLWTEGLAALDAASTAQHGKAFADSDARTADRAPHRNREERVQPDDAAREILSRGQGARRSSATTPARSASTRS